MNQKLDRRLRTLEAGNADSGEALLCEWLACVGNDGERGEVLGGQMIGNSAVNAAIDRYLLLVAGE
ncbi:MULTISPECIES: hypothetical protein [Asticcacaulis]|uniref:hypothetical protein n=1 Tax=Asticcacaulis TaxID=76890 RepID=UPI001AE5A85C|nr:MULTISPECIES: hypothetical protein [Asticcacaulis]MBP2159553.1 hypothetical protein [Asticcacaulis solisilvae]MDR6800620.1 hypothetical protein [Asticcacaulis sp. BE141]